MGYFNSNSLGKITSITTNTLEALSDITTRVVMVTTQGLLTVATIIFFVLIYDWRIGCLLILGLLIFLIPNSIMRRSVVGVSVDKQQIDAELVDSVLEYVQGSVEVKNYNLTKSSAKKLAQTIANKKIVI